MELLNRHIKLSSRGAEIKVACLGCIHHGHSACNERLADFWYRRILNAPDTYCILGGDLVDSIFERDKRYCEQEVARWCRDRKWGGTLIDRQFRYALEKWRPLAEAGKILWLHEGNHEQELRLRASRDLALDWCRELKIPYAGYQAHTNLICHYGKPRRGTTSLSFRVTFFTTHGSGSAQTDGAVMNKVASLMNDYDADISIMWHLHRRMHILKRSEGIGEPRVNTPPIIRNRDRLAAICGTFLDRRVGITNYGERKGFKPIVPGPSVIHIKYEPAPSAWQRQHGRAYAPGTRIWISDAIVEPRVMGEGLLDEGGVD